MNLTRIIKLANKAQESGDYSLSRILSKIALDVALVDSNNYIKKQLKIAHWEAENIKKELKNLQMKKLSEEVDIIAQDLEARIIQFEASDPLEAVLDSYNLLHKVASANRQASGIQDVVEIAEDKTLTDDQIIEEIKRKTLGNTLNDKKNILYILEKDYNISIPLDKIASKKKEDKLVTNPKTKQEKAKNREIIKKILDEEYGEDIDADRFKWTSSYTSAPSIWQGFSFETPVPYQQHNQLNFWSLASKDEDEILNKIARIQK